MMRIIELRSDTFTRPTEAMRRAMYEADVGDDVWEEDPTVCRLEALAAELTGKEAGLFVSSGTQGNLVGVLSHTSPGQEVIVGDRSHIFLAEAAGTAIIGGLQLKTIANRADGSLDPEEVAAAVRLEDIHYPVTGCVCVENTHGATGGRVIAPQQIRSVSDVAHGFGIPVHMDGARAFNAAVALGVSVGEVTASVDSVTFCLSKGLGAPVGSVLCGARPYIQRARRWRKILGGGMRQVGVLAAAGLEALGNNVDRLAEDHANALRLASGLAMIPGIVVEPRRVDSNMVFLTLEDPGVDPAAFIACLAERGVRVGLEGGRADTVVRAVTSYEVNQEDIDYALDVIRDLVRESAPLIV